MKKVLFLHGFFASGDCLLAQTLSASLSPTVDVLTPDLPLYPAEALGFILHLCETERPHLLVGNSCGAFYAQMAATQTGLPALLGNPHLEMSTFLSERLGSHQYKSPRANHNQQLTIDQHLVDAFGSLIPHQFDHYTSQDKERIWGLFGDNDGLAHFETLFKKYYTNSFHFPGGHTPTAEEVRLYYVPLIKQMLGLYQ